MRDGFHAADGDTVQGILGELRRYCPELDGAVALGVPDVREVPWLPGYRLVRLPVVGPGGDGSLAELYGWYAPGDFRPVQEGGGELEALALVAPLVIDAGTVLDYALIRFRLHAGALLPDPGSPEDGEGPPVGPPTTSIAFQDWPPSDAGEVPAIPGHLFLRPAGVVGELPGGAFRVRVPLVQGWGPGAQLRQVTARVGPDGAVAVEGVDELAGKLPGPPPPPGIPRIFPRRAQVPFRMRTWERLSPEESARWGEVVEPRLPSPGGALLRRAPLPFYREWWLLEVLQPVEAGYRRSYALAHMDEGRPRLRPLDGTSGVIHETNGEEGELLLGDGDPTAVDAYLSFFCWATHGDEGPFHLPSTPWEVAIRGADGPIDRGIRRVVNDLDYSLRPVDEEEAVRVEYPAAGRGMVRRRALVAYGTGVFEAWFAVEPDGSITMVHEEPRLADLQVESDAYGEGDLFVLRAGTGGAEARPASPRPALQHPLWAGNGAEGREPEEMEEKEAEPLSGAAFLAALAASGTVHGRTVQGPVLLDDAALGG